jgi:integrase
MAGKRRGKRLFGSVRQLPSGNWQARYLGPGGIEHTAPETFATERDADDFLAEVQTDMRRGNWLNPDAGQVEFRVYATKWVEERDLKPRSRQEYDRTLRLHILPILGGKALAQLKPPVIRSWRKTLQDNEVGKSTVAKSYRILKAILNTAVDDELIRRNPCRIAGAGQDKAEERPTATLDEVFRIASTIQPRYRLLVWLACFASLRFGELIGLRRRHVFPDVPELKVAIATGELDGGIQYDDDPKSDAGKRTIALPAAIATEISEHLKVFALPGPDGRLFVGPQGGIPTRRNFNRVWKKALKAAQVNPDLHLHDLRHTGATLAGQQASLKELMARIGHSSTRAAMIYQHATRERDHAIAAALDLMIQEARGEPAA